MSPKVHADGNLSEDSSNASSGTAVVVGHDDGYDLGLSGDGNRDENPALLEAKDIPDRVAVPHLRGMSSLTSWLHTCLLVFSAFVLCLSFFRDETSKADMSRRVDFLQNELLQVRSELSTLVVAATADINHGFDALAVELGHGRDDHETSWTVMENYITDITNRMHHNEIKLMTITSALQGTIASMENLQNKGDAQRRDRFTIDILPTSFEKVALVLMRDVWSDEEESVGRALNSLLVYADETRETDFNSEFRAAGGHALIVHLMARWRRSKKIQYLCFQILGLLPLKLQKHAVSLGALESILFAMKSFANDENLVQNALFALYHLCAKHTSNMTRLVERLDALPSIFEAMQRFQESEMTQYWGCRLLEAISKKNQFSHAIVMSGGLQILSETFSKWPHTSEQSKRGVMELARLSLARLVGK